MTVYSAQKTQWNQNNPTERIKTNELAGRVRIAYATYEASSLSNGEVIEMFNLPNGARIVGGSLGYDALGASTTLSVGYAAHTDSSDAAVSSSATAFKAAASTASAGLVDVCNTIALNYGLEADANQDGMPVTVTLGGANATGTIVLSMQYVTD